ncbi:MAG TPA: hypothetical protein VER58_20280 [Thermoanaerobaculia bacterium]|nr:hypothetical protein [Thermoanaerobaculia bacterium]
MKRFLVLAAAIAIVHFAIAVVVLFVWAKYDTPVDHPTWESFGYSASVLVLTPLFPFVKHVSFYPLIALNSLMWAVVMAAVIAPIRRWWLWIPIGVIALPLLWFGILITVDNVLEKRVDRAWKTRLGARAPIAQRFQRSPANATARGVDQFAGKLLGGDFDRVRSSVIAYVSAQLARGDDAVEERPANGEHYIVEHRYDIDGLEHFLQTNDAPQWEIDLEALERPGSVRYYNLHRIILLDALESTRKNDFDSARKYVELAYRLTASLRTRPEVLAVVSAMAATNTQLGVVRKLPGDATPLPRFDARERLIDAREAEAWTMRHVVATSSFAPKRNNALLDILVRPYARLCAIVRSSDELRNSLVTRNFDRCVFQPPKEPDDTSPVPNPINSDSAAHAATLAVRASRLAIDFEGSERIAALKRSPNPAVFASMCPNRKWLFDGHLLHLEPALPSGPLPSKHRITAAQKSSSGTSIATAHSTASSK